MCPIEVNVSPSMTRYLVEDKRIFAEEPLVFVDVGARAGVNAEWAVFADQAKFYCFEPDEAECSRLAADAPGNVTYIPTALGGSSGLATLYESRLSFSTSLYKTDMKYFGRFANGDNGEVMAEHTVRVKSLADAMRDFSIPQFDFLKLDTEGAELDILKGGREAVGSPQLLGILSEIRLHAEINGSPTFSSLDHFLQGEGFRLYDLSVNHHSRRALPYPQIADYRLPSGERFYAYTRHGQVQDGDALYFRDLLNRPGLKPLQILKICALLEIYCLSDCAGELIAANREILASVVDPEHLLDLLSQGVSGAAVSYRDYVSSYFAPAPAVVAVDPPVEPIDDEGDDVPVQPPSEKVVKSGLLKRVISSLRRG